MMCNAFSLLHDSAGRYPDKAYVIDKNIKYTYSEVYQKTIRLAEQIGSSGINAGERILIYLDNSVEYIAAFFSILLSNCIAVPINKNTTLENFKYIISNIEPKIIISSDLFMKRINCLPELNTIGKLTVDMASAGCSCTFDADSYAGLGTGLTAGLGTGVYSGIKTDSELPAIILYTSGTTRAPKGVTLTHKNLLANTESILQYLQLTHEDSILATINFSYSYGDSLLLTHTKVGGTIVIENRVSYPVKIIEQLHLSKVTGFSTVGSYINILLKQDMLKAYHLHKLRYITFAGESTSFADIVKLNSIAPHIKIFVMYGQTEATARLSYLEPSMLFEKAGSIGKGIPGVALRVVTDEGRGVNPGEVGEIIASGDNIMKGYWNNKEDTEAVIRDGWLYTGDLATVDEDGYLYVKGRKDDIIKYLGHRISPVEIEAVINSCGQVLESAVVGVVNEDGNQIKAYIVPKSDGYDKDEIAAHIRRHLPAFKRPAVTEFIHELPKSNNGKIKRCDLRKPGNQ